MRTIDGDRVARWVWPAVALLVVATTLFLVGAL
jgi:hypothetical protein